MREETVAHVRHPPRSLVLKNTFLHLPGIGSRGEARLWASGIRCWHDLKEAVDPNEALFDPRVSLIGRKPAAGIHHELERSEAALDRLDSAYFAARLPRSEHWRMLPE